MTRSRKETLRSFPPVPFWVMLALFVLASALPLPLRGQQRAAPSPDFNLTLTGDSIIMQPLSPHQGEPGFMAAVNAVRKGDAAFTNLELTFPGRNAWPAAQSGGTWMNADPALLKEMQWVGINLFSSANNHALDYGIEGLLDTMRTMKEAGAVYAGMGESLGEARAPGYLKTAYGRVALIACAATFTPAEPAGEQRPDMRGRPGISPLRHQTRYGVDATSLDALRKIKSDLKLTPPNGSAEPSTPSQTVNLTLESSSTFELSDKPGIVTMPNPRDVAAIAHSIQDAKEMSDYVVTSIHAHDGAPGDREAPAQYVVAFAHAAVDAGTDVFVGHGPHFLRGIEIYKGKVIFYSMGNFVFDDDLIRVLPQDIYDQQGLGLDALPAAVYDARNNHDQKGFPSDPIFWQSVVAQVVFHDGHPAKVLLTPITLGFKGKRWERGYPQAAEPAMASQILEHLQKLSQRFGTKIAIQNGIGTISVAEE